MTPGQVIVLVGPDRQENLGLQYLAAAVEQAGHRASLVSLNVRDDVGPAVRRVMEAGADVVGLGIPFQHSIDDALLFVRTLRQDGFAGHVTCGGHVATFCHEQLLRDAPEIDTIVRHEGEQTLVALLECLSQNRAVRAIDGLVWREGDAVVTGAHRPPVADLDSLPLPNRRPEPLVVGGVPSAFLITSRGCVGRCAYCCVEALAADAGGARYRLRDPEAVAQEIAALHHERGVRVFVLQDDLFILTNEHRAVERISAIAHAQRRLGVENVAHWIKGRPDTITPDVLRAARDMGVIHLFLGVENALATRLQYLGRPHRPADNRRAIAACQEQGIVPSFNLMLFDPESTLEDVAANIDFAAEHLGLPWNVCRTEVYSGTQLRQRLADAGRLEGDYRGYGYRMSDVRAEIMFRILRICLHERAFAYDSLLNRLISLCFARQVHRCFFPGAGTDHLDQEVEQLTARVYRDTVETLRSTLDFVAVADVTDGDQVRRQAVQQALAIQRRDAPWGARADDLWQRLHARGRTLGRQLIARAPLTLTQRERR